MMLANRRAYIIAALTCLNEATFIVQTMSSSPRLGAMRVYIGFSACLALLVSELCTTAENIVAPLVRGKKMTKHNAAFGCYLPLIVYHTLIVKRYAVRFRR